jgi:branched-subunit amino acid aminotransferase/4-amino-4-deoxychorismate lyase
VTATDDSVLRWCEDGLVPAAGADAGALLAADSWLVAGGAVRALDAHWERFGGWCTELGISSDFAGFRAAVTAALPRGRERWFPRVEAVARASSAPVDAVDVPELRLRLRPAPAPAATARVLLAEPGDPRTRPRWKGPDLERLIGLRAHAIARGADELLLRDAGGRLLEGALSSLLWWEDDVLCTTPADRTFPGVTRALLLDLAGRRGVRVRTRSPAPDELRHRETWLTSALHGIRLVEGWGPPSRAADWQAALGALARPLDSGP